MTGEGAGTGVDAQRVVEIIVSRRDGGDECGSGYLVRSGRVLTAGHVVAEARSVTVRFNADLPDERCVAAAVLWADAGCDVAVLGLPDERGIAPALFGRLDAADGRAACRSVGYPLFKLRRYPDRAALYRDSHDAHGHIAPLSNRRERTLEVVVPPPAGVDGGSPWAGMSGAAVWVADRIVGVVSLHHPSDGLGVLAAGRVDTWAEALAPERLVELERLLDVRLGRAYLAPARARPRQPEAWLDSRLDHRPAPAFRAAASTSEDAHRPRSGDWRGGDEVTIGDRIFLLLDGLVDNAVPAHAPVRTRQAQATRIGPTDRNSSPYVWLRQVERLGPSAAGPVGNASSAACAALSREHRMLTAAGRVPGLPRLAGHFTAERSETLALDWPVTADGGPCPTLRQRFGADPQPLDPWRLGRMLAGVTVLCRALAGLHLRGCAHRAVGRDTVLVVEGPGLVLRDLGLAASEPRRGEAPVEYAAPEQRLNHRRSAAGRPGPATDIYQLAAVVYHLTTGRPPAAGAPLPMAAANPGAHPPLAELVDGALRAEAGSRPTAPEFGAALAEICKQLA